MPYALINDTRLYYEVHGDGPPLVLISGFSVDATYWDPLRPFLENRFKLVIFDNRSAGRSDCPPGAFTIEQLADDTAALIDHLDLKKPHILGHSMGGAIAQAVAHSYPDKINKAIFSHALRKARPLAIAVLLHYIHLIEDGATIRRQAEGMIPWLFSNEFLSDPKRCEFFFQKKETEPFPTTLAALKKQETAILQFNPDPWFKQISVPVLVLSSDEDLLCPVSSAQELAQGIRGAEFHSFSNQAHVTPIEKPEEYARVITKFLL